MTVVVAALTGALGALARYVLSGKVQQRTRSSMPLGTAAVNLAGALALGLIIGAGHPTSAWSTAGAGFLGGFTTFSTWMVETVRLGAVPTPSRRAIVNLTAMAACGVLLAAAGYSLTN